MVPHILQTLQFFRQKRVVFIHKALSKSNITCIYRPQRSTSNWNSYSFSSWQVSYSCAFPIYQGLCPNLTPTLWTHQMTHNLLRLMCLEWLPKSGRVSVSTKAYCPPKDGCLEPIAVDKLVLSGLLPAWRKGTVPSLGWWIYCSPTIVYRYIYLLVE